MIVAVVIGGVVSLGTLAAFGLARACRAGDEAMASCWDWSDWEEELSER